MTARPKANRTVGLQFDAVSNHETMSRHAAALIEDEVRFRPNLLLCAAAGSSPRRTYQLLGESARKEPALFRQMRVIKIDEWGGLAMADSATCEVDLIQHLLVPLEITPDRYQGFNSEARDPQAECDRVAKWLGRYGPIDLCVLGVGVNGHIAMNEPADALRPGPHVAQLAPSSLQHPMLATSAAKPHYGLSLGMRDILQSRKILLLASGEPKRAGLERLRKPAISSQFPVSFLWLHPDVTVISALP